MLQRRFSIASGTMPSSRFHRNEFRPPLRKTPAAVILRSPVLWDDKGSPYLLDPTNAEILPPPSGIRMTRGAFSRTHLSPLRRNWLSARLVVLHNSLAGSELSPRPILPRRIDAMPRRGGAGEENPSRPIERVQRAGAVDSAGQQAEVSLDQPCMPRERAHGDKEISLRKKRTPELGHRDRIRRGSDGSFGRDADPVRRDGPR
jgi:hypothetical protein